MRASANTALNAGIASSIFRLPLLRILSGWNHSAVSGGAAAAVASSASSLPSSASSSSKKREKIAETDEKIVEHWNQRLEPNRIIYAIRGIGLTLLENEIQTIPVAPFPFFQNTCATLIIFTHAEGKRGWEDRNNIDQRFVFFFNWLLLYSVQSSAECNDCTNAN